jgi:hypothetical protein
MLFYERSELVGMRRLSASMRFDLLRFVILGDFASHRSVAAKRSAGSVVHKRAMYVNPRLSRRDVGPPSFAIQAFR